MNSDEKIMPWIDDPDAKKVEISFFGTRAQVPVTLEAISSEITDQAEVKKPQRKAILRGLEKKLLIYRKKGHDKLSAQEQEHKLFALFVFWIDQSLDGQHLNLRANPQAIQDFAEQLWDKLD